MDELLSLLKFELGIEDDTKDNLLKVYINKCVHKVMDITKQSETYVLSALIYVVMDLVVIMYNRRGTEGVSNQSANGMSESYINDIPRDIKKQLYSHRRLGGLR